MRRRCAPAVVGILLFCGCGKAINAPVQEGAARSLPAAVEERAEREPPSALPVAAAAQGTTLPERPSAPADPGTSARSSNANKPASSLPETAPQASTPPGSHTQSPSAGQKVSDPQEERPAAANADRPAEQKPSQTNTITLARIDPDAEFKDISAQFETARHERKIHPTGHVELYELYNVAVTVYLHGAKTWDERMKTLQQWRDEIPSDATPLIALARGHVKGAWEARGSGFASTVSQEGWKVFQDRLELAATFAEQARKMEPKDPELYRVLVDIGKGQQANREKIDEWVERGREIDPTYYPLYLATAEYLLPRWHGQAGDVERFAEEIRTAVGGDDGLDAYGRIVQRMNLYDKQMLYFGGFARDQVADAMKLLLRRYPRSVQFDDIAALVMWKEMDHQGAQALHTRLKEPNLTHWGTQSRYDQFVRWCESPPVTDLPAKYFWADTYGTTGIAFSADGKSLFTSSNHGPGALKMWDLDNIERPRALPGPDVEFNRVAAESTGRFVMASSSIFRKYAAVVWNLTKPTAPVIHVEPDAAEGMALAPNGRLAATCEKDKVHLWDPATGDEIRTINGLSAKRMKFSPSGKWLAVMLPSGLQIYSTETGEKLYEARARSGDRGAAYGVSYLTGFLPDESLLCVGQKKVEKKQDSFLVRWLPETDEFREICPLSQGEIPLTIGAGSVVATLPKSVGTRGTEIKIYRLTDGKLLRTINGHYDRVSDAAFSPDAHWLASLGMDGPVRLWNLDGQE